MAAKVNTKVRGWTTLSLDPNAKIRQIKLKIDRPYEWFAGFQLIDEDGKVVASIDKEPHKKEWVT